MKRPAVATSRCANGRRAPWLVLVMLQLGFPGCSKNPGDECTPYYTDLGPGEKVGGVDPLASIAAALGDHTGTLTWNEGGRLSVLHLQFASGPWPAKVSKNACDETVDAFEVSITVHVSTDDGILDGSGTGGFRLDASGKPAQAYALANAEIGPLIAAGVVPTAAAGGSLVLVTITLTGLVPQSGTVSVSVRADAQPAGLVQIGTIVFTP